MCCLHITTMTQQTGRLTRTIIIHRSSQATVETEHSKERKGKRTGG